MSRSAPALAAAALALLALLHEPSPCAAELADSYSGTSTSTKHDVSGTWLELPRAHAALSGDVRGSVRGKAPERARIRLRRDHDDGPVILATLPLVLDIEHRFTIPCGYFGRGGVYYIDLLEAEITDEISDRNDNFISSGGSDFLEDDENQVEYESSNTIKSNLNYYDRKDNGNLLNVNKDGNKSNFKDNVLDHVATKSWRFDVLWPTSRLSVTPELIETYPERPVTAILEFPDAVCSPLDSNADFWLELLYCGHASGGAVLCDGRNVTSNAHVLYSEEVRGFPGRRTVSLRCELFGQAGDFALTLRPAAAAPPAVRATAFLKADWSQQFVLNVHARSVFPCASGGVRALFQYPACVLERADRVRLFAREVTGYGGAAAGSLRYVTERRVRRGQHAAAFDCELFQERFPEYCFVYVSQSVTGAVADVRMDCVPTMPLAEGSAGAWGPWSAWSSCPAGPACARATRSRHRFCDSPPPTYGAAFCQGTGVEVSACSCNGTSVSPLWGSVSAAAGAACRCGCVLHVSRTPRTLAASTRACPGRTFWLLQAEWGHAVQLRVERAHLPCGAQWLRARAGDSLAATLIATWPRDDELDSNHTAVEVSSVRYLLLEMYSDEVAAAGEFCAGGFIAHAQEIESSPGNNSVAADRRWAGAGAGGVGGAAQAAALALAGGAVAAALALALHSAARTRHYKRAADKESLTDSDACSASLELVEQADKGSRATLLSEMSAEIVPAGRVCLRKFLSGRSRAKHQRLRESDVTFEDDEAKLKEDGMEVEIVSSGSTSTLTAPVGAGCVSASAAAATLSAPCTPTPQASPLRRSQTISGGGESDRTKNSPGRLKAQPSVINVAPSLVSESSAAEMSTSFSSMSERELGSMSERELGSTTDCDKDSAIGDNAASCSSRASSAATLTNGCYSPGLSGVNVARVRAPGRRGKDSINPRRVLRSSDLSLAQQEMELDYYDYEVNNAGAAPGSYLGMDPAFLVWIPPLDEGDIIQEMDEKHHLYEEILPRIFHPDPGSNTESPENENPSIVKVECHKERETKRNSGNSPKLPQKAKNRMNVIAPLNFSISDLQKDSPRLSRRNSNRSKYNPSPISIQMTEMSNLNSSPVQQSKNHNNEIRQTQRSSLQTCPVSELSNKRTYSVKEIINIENSSVLQKNSENSITQDRDLDSSSGKKVNILRSSPVRVHKKYSEKETEKHFIDNKVQSEISEIKFADDNSDSSNEIQFMDDDCVDSNKIMEQLEMGN